MICFHLGETVRKEWGGEQVKATIKEQSRV